MEPEFKTTLITEELLGSKYAKLYSPFKYYSKILNQDITVPTGFICDYESVPLLKASSKRAGVLHDYLCRIDSIPTVTKQQAASVYLESQACRDKMLHKGKGLFFRLGKLLKRQFKTIVVRLAPGYFHKYYVLSSLSEISGE